MPCLTQDQNVGNIVVKKIKLKILFSNKLTKNKCDCVPFEIYFGKKKIAPLPGSIVLVSERDVGSLLPLVAFYIELLFFFFFCKQKYFSVKSCQVCENKYTDVKTWHFPLIFFWLEMLWVSSTILPQGAVVRTLRL